MLEKIDNTRINQTKSNFNEQSTITTVSFKLELNTFKSIHSVKHEKTTSTHFSAKILSWDYFFCCTFNAEIIFVVLRVIL